MNQMVRQIGYVLILATIPALVSLCLYGRHPWGKKSNSVKVVTLTQVSTYGNVLWVDARSRAEYDREHIPGGLLLNEEEWDALLPPLLDQWQPEQWIVIYCDSKQCHNSKSLALRLREAGLENVYLLKGGWVAWTKSRQQ